VIANLTHMGILTFITILLIVRNAFAQPTRQMLELAEVAQRHSESNVGQWGPDAMWQGRSIQVERGRGSLKSFLAWAHMRSGYGRIPKSAQEYVPDLSVRAIESWMGSKANYDALIAGGPHAFVRSIDADIQAGGYRFGIKRIVTSALPMAKDCPRGAFLVMASGGPTNSFADGDLLICHGPTSMVGYNGFIKRIKDVDNTHILGMFAPYDYVHPLPPPPVQPVVQPVVQPRVVQPVVQPRVVQPVVQPRVVQPVVQPRVVQPVVQPRVVQPVAQPWVVPVGAIPNTGFVSISAAVTGENSQLSVDNSSQDSTPVWAVALIVVSCAVLVALVVLVGQLSCVIKQTSTQ